MADTSRRLSAVVRLLADGAVGQQEAAASGTLRFRARVLSADTDLIDSWRRVLRIPAAVLQAAAPRWVGVPVKLDHDRDVLATVGRVLSAEWVDAAGDVPGGVEAEIEILRTVSEDAETLARLVESRLVSSLSSGFAADWQRSHPGLSQAEWQQSYGQTVDGETVCEVAREISEVHEVSLVDLGGDPYSRRLRAAGGHAMGKDRVDLAGKPLDEKSFVSALMALVGVGLDTSLEDLLGAVGKVMQGKDPGGEKKPEPPAEKKPEPPAPPAKPEEEMASASLARLCALLTPEGQAQLSAEAAAVEAIRLRTEFVPRGTQPTQIDVALAEGRITPAEVATLRPIEEAAPDALRTYLASRPRKGAVPIGPAQHRQGPESAQPEISDRVRQLGKLAGVAPEKIQERLSK